MNTPLPTNSQALPPSIPSAPQAKRFTLSSWFHKRSIAGIFLILFSAGGAFFLVSEGDSTTEVWAAREDLGAGTTLSKDDLVKRSVNLTESLSLYMKASDNPEGKTLQASLQRDELLPKSALSENSKECGGLITLAVAKNHIPTRVSRGDYINVYSADQRVLESAVVDKVQKPASGILSSASTWSLDLRLHPDAVKDAVQLSQKKPEEIDIEISSQKGNHTDPCKKPKQSEGESSDSQDSDESENSNSSENSESSEEEGENSNTNTTVSPSPSEGRLA